uniref:Uncharacterized protein n=1 Tax=Arundo donax TaxID=35708 RepID=A0A0A9DH24_ARUDO
MPTKFEMNWCSSTLVTAVSSPSVPEAGTPSRGSCSILIPNGSKISSTFSSGTVTAAVEDSPTAELAAATKAILCCCT